VREQQQHKSGNGGVVLGNDFIQSISIRMCKGGGEKEQERNGRLSTKEDRRKKRE